MKKKFLFAVFLIVLTSLFLTANTSFSASADALKEPEYTANNGNNAFTRFLPGYSGGTLSAGNDADETLKTVGKIVVIVLLIVAGIMVYVDITVIKAKKKDKTKKDPFRQDPDDLRYVDDRFAKKPEWPSIVHEDRPRKEAGPSVKQSPVYQPPVHEPVRQSQAQEVKIPETPFPEDEDYTKTISVRAFIDETPSAPSNSGSSGEADFSDATEEFDNCPACGKLVMSSTKFCPFCGNKLK